ncbi:MAG: dienelactone hydrolase family protein [Gammaproteobacteria bacterium]|nr:dienelactone hydrolase family protein [Gammaproteobacteria bacterium]
MLVKFRFFILIVFLFTANQASAQAAGEDNSWWWEDSWWNEGLIEATDNHAIETSWTSYVSDDVEVPSLVLRPADDGKYPAVLFVHGRRGLDELVQRHARRVAARGFVVLAPDIYGAHFLGTHPIEHDYELEKDVDLAVEVLLKRNDISTSKACLYSHTRGGYYTLKVATTFKRQDEDIACYVSFYPHLQDPNAPEPSQVYGYAPEIEELTLPVMVFIGDEEQYQRRRVIETSINVLRDRGRDARLIIYPGVGRGFDFRPETVRTFADDLASKDSVQRAAKFMRLHLTASTNMAASGEPLTGEALYNSDKAPASMLYDLPREVVPGVWSAIGATAPGTYANSGHNNNLSFVITNAGVLVVNAGDNYLLAKALHEEIKKITDQPVRYVVLENGQGHAMLGSSYWQEQGVPVIAHIEAQHEIEEQSFALLETMQARVKEKAEGTKVVLPDETFEDKKIIQLGDERIELLNLGPAHSPGDIIVWLPGKQVVISGDMAFHQRMLPLFEHTDSGAWIETWDKFEALGAEVVIPGHGDPTDMATVRKYTRDYLVFLREKVGELIENGGTLQEAYQIDQSAYMHLPTAEFLAKRNAGQVFQSMEFEF